VTATFKRPSGVFASADGNLLIVDTENQAIRKMDMNQTVTTVALIPNVYIERKVDIRNPLSVIQDKNRNIYVGRVNTIQKIGAGGLVTTVAGGFNDYKIIGRDANGPVYGRNYFDGYASAAELGAVSGMTFDSKGNLIFVDCDSRRVRKLTPDGNVTTIAGSMENQAGTTDGNGLKARFTCPKAITIDEADNLYVADFYINPKFFFWPGYTYVANANYIRKITPQGDVTTLAGNGSEFTSVGKLPANLASPSALVYEKNSRSLLVTSGTALFRVVLP
jgi:hypothetical protein